jgi:hypothetical protein
VERALALRDVMDHAVKVQRESKQLRIPRRKVGRLVTALAICVPLLAASVYSVMARPAAIWGAGEPARDPVVHEAEMRFGTILIAQRIEAYRLAVGHYPRSLAVLGADTTAVAYDVVGDAEFLLTTMVNGKPVVYRSGDSPESFLGNSAAVLRSVQR